MSEHFLPQFLRGQDEASVHKALTKSAKGLARGQSVTEALHPIPSPDSERSDIPIYLSRMVSGDGFYVAGLLPLVYDIWMNRALGEDDAGFDRAVLAATGIYADVLSRPWGVLCALAYDSFVWLRLGYSPDDDLDPTRTGMFLEAVHRESAWLRSLDGRFSGPLSDKPGFPWAVHNLVTFLAARHHLTQPTSWESWEATISQLRKETSRDTTAP